MDGAALQLTRLQGHPMSQKGLGYFRSGVAMPYLVLEVLDGGHSEVAVSAGEQGRQLARFARRGLIIW